MKLLNKIAKKFGMKYPGRPSGVRNRPKEKTILDQSQHILQLRDDARQLQRKYEADNITVVIYDSNSNIEFMVGPEVKELALPSNAPTTIIPRYDHVATEERTNTLKDAIKRLEKPNENV